MKVLIASDLHGSAHYCRLLLDAFQKERADRLVLLGDLLTTAPGTRCRRSTTPWPSPLC